MWKTKHRVEIKDGWGYYVFDLVWEYGIVEDVNWPAIRDTVDYMVENTKNDRRWDCLTDAMKLLEEMYAKSADFSNEK